MLQSWTLVITQTVFASPLRCVDNEEKGGGEGEVDGKNIQCLLAADF